MCTAGSARCFACMSHSAISPSESELAASDRRELKSVPQLTPHYLMNHPSAYHQLGGLSDTLSVSFTAWTLASIHLHVMEHGAQVGLEKSAEAALVIARTVAS